LLRASVKEIDVQGMMHTREISNLQSLISMIDTFESAVAFIQSLDRVDTPLHSREYHFRQGIARAKHLLARLGGAPISTTRCIIVTGSKGKGSTVAMLSSILSAAGLKVGVFTGPHLHTPVERFAITQHGHRSLMPEDTFIDFALRIEGIVQTWDAPAIGHPTRFEAFTAMAYRWFDDQGVDIAVMEIGIGGRLDAVNLADPMLSILTNISLEHTQMLGDTVGQIAREKAGIMRAGRPAIFAQQTSEAIDVLCDEAASAGAFPIQAEHGWHCAPAGFIISPGQQGQWFTCNDARFFMPLLGAYQLQNAAAALASVDALREMGIDISANAVEAGFMQTQWRGRFDLLSFQPVIIVDGAHTPYSMAQLCASLQAYFPGRRIHFIMGTLRDKDSHGIVAAAGSAATSLVFCDMDARRATPASHLMELWRALPRHEYANVQRDDVAAHLPDALHTVQQWSSEDDVICITGSLHLVAEAERAVAERVRLGDKMTGRKGEEVKM
jgi:dihydrofolate synthase/folylpolyglutamate synthase